MNLPLFVKPSGAALAHVSSYRPQGGEAQDAVVFKEKSSVTELPGSTAGKSKI
jgi:hypothetical protein